MALRVGSGLVGHSYEGPVGDKIEWAEKKFKPPEPASAFKDWAKRIATGRGKGRHTHDVLSAASGTQPMCAKGLSHG